MNEDLEEELQLFLEDMDDQLSIMETTLLDISEVPLDEIDKEMINNLFRAMHTMKGNAGVFGYDVIIDFSHKAENLLDLIRNDKISLSEELIELFLLIKDHSKLLVKLSTQDIPLEGENKHQHDFLLQELTSHLNNDKINEEKTESSQVETTEETAETLLYDINLKLKNDFFESGMEMQSIIKYLCIIGEIIDLQLIEDDIPLFDKLNPKKAYIKFHIKYKTKEQLSEIEEAFEFVQEDIELKIDLATEDITPLEEKKDIEFQIFKKPNKKIVPKTVDTKIAPKIETNMSLRVDSSKIDVLINQISEMVIANAKITQYALNSKDTEFEEAVTIMSEMLEEIRDGVMDIRMVQVGDSFSKFRRIVTDTAKQLSKDISFEIVGGETELDKTVIEKISDPIVHMLRNSIDHGIETQEVREEHNKNKKGHIILKAYPDAGTIVIQIIDDGAGIDKDHVLQKAIEKHIVDKNVTLNDKEIFNLLFSPGFSTAKELSNISGRGVGMDVVKRNIEELRGHVEIESILGKGTTVTIRLPLTLAIIDGFLVQVGKSKYIIPLDTIQECIELTSESKKQFLQQGYISLRKSVLPILNLSEHFGEIKDKIEEKTKRENIVVVRNGRSSVGLKVDELFGEFQTVIKPLGKVFENVSDISGGTILGNGEIALILDVQKLIKDKISQKEV
jgi:two-component system chemotaxis sensor kinase CheA